MALEASRRTADSFSAAALGRSRGAGSHRPARCRTRFGGHDSVRAYAPLVKSRVGRVILRCQKPLVTLLRSLSGVDEIIGQEDQVPHFDAWVPLLSVPQFFTPAIENIPRHSPLPLRRRLARTILAAASRAIRRAAGRRSLARKPRLPQGPISLDSSGLFRAAGKTARRSADQSAKRGRNRAVDASNRDISRRRPGIETRGNPRSVPRHGRHLAVP